MAADSHGQAVGVQYSLKVGAKGSWKSSQKSKSLINGPALTFFKVKKIKGETHQTIRWATTVHTTTTSNEILTLWQKDLPMVPVHQEEPSAWCYHHFLKKGGPIFHPTFFVPFSANFFFLLLEILPGSPTVLPNLQKPRRGAEQRTGTYMRKEKMWETGWAWHVCGLKNLQLSGVISQLRLKQPQKAIVPFKNSPFSKGFQLYNRKLRHSEPSLADCQAQLPQWNCSNLCTSLGTSRQDINHIQSS